MLTSAAVLAGVGTGVGIGTNLLTGYLNYNNQKDTLAWQKIYNVIYLHVRTHQ